MWLLAGLLLAAIAGGTLALINRRPVVLAGLTSTPASGARATATLALVADQATAEATAIIAVVPPDTATPQPATPTVALIIEPATAAPTEPPLVVPTAPPTAAPPTEPPAATTVPLSADLQQIVDLVNEQRSIRGIAPLSVSAQLVAAAQSHSDDMAANNFFSDIGSDGSDPKTRINRNGYIASGWVENIGAGYSQPFDVVQSWFDDPASQDNLLNASMRDVGVGYAANPSSQYGRYWTIVYARP
jgi:uncharacterized protein YkwD